ncbi:MAG TPA: phenylalanine--tRNA ligase subunit alpha [Flavobacteriales bacterium]|jgi:phenylalanyl-tRNA synthetase alpha chain|nr:phenylalanine--tRNA ligase subunit alpha [Flavobacteriales bacterium]
MLEEVKELLLEVEKFVPKSAIELEGFRLSFLGKKGKTNELFAAFKEVPSDQKKDFGAAINNLKQLVQSKIKEHKDSFEVEAENSEIDLTRPVALDNLGSRHPISLIRNEIVEIFTRIGFTISEGPEIEDDWHNFSALNTPKEHPARDMQDTFFIQTNPDILLRSHTSTVQVRYMNDNKPPIRTLSPGRVYRNEAISARAHCIFHQVEGLYIDEDVSFADLKQCLLYFAKEMFGEKTKIRLRPSYFPFTEPSAEVDVSCNICNSKGCNVCKNTGYLEILGCGMVDPNVLENCGIDSKKYSGFAFGMGIERIAMLKYGVKDLRLFFENDVRFLKQFSAL